MTETKQPRVRVNEPKENPNAAGNSAHNVEPTTLTKASRWSGFPLSDNYSDLVDSLKQGVPDYALDAKLKSDRPTLTLKGKTAKAIPSNPAKETSDDVSDKASEAAEASEKARAPAVIVDVDIAKYIAPKSSSGKSGAYPVVPNSTGDAVDVNLFERETSKSSQRTPPNNPTHIATKSNSSTNSIDIELAEMWKETFGDDVVSDGDASQGSKIVTPKVKLKTSDHLAKVDNDEQTLIANAKAEMIATARKRAVEAEADRTKSANQQARKSLAARAERKRVKRAQVEAARSNAQRAEALRVKAVQQEAAKAQAERAENKRKEDLAAEARVKAVRAEMARARIAAADSVSSKVRAANAKALKVEAAKAKATQAEIARVEAAKAEAAKAEAAKAQREESERQRAAAVQVEARKAQAQQIEKAKRADAARINAQQAESNRADTARSEQLAVEQAKAAASLEIERLNAENVASKIMATQSDSAGENSTRAAEVVFESMSSKNDSSARPQLAEEVDVVWLDDTSEITSVDIVLPPNAGQSLRADDTWSEDIYALDETSAGPLVVDSDDYLNQSMEFMAALQEEDFDDTSGFSVPAASFSIERKKRGWIIRTMESIQKMLNTVVSKSQRWIRTRKFRKD